MSTQFAELDLGEVGVHNLLNIAGNVPEAYRDAFLQSASAAYLQQAARGNAPQFGSPPEGNVASVRGSHFAASGQSNSEIALSAEAPESAQLVTRANQRSADTKIG